MDRSRSRDGRGTRQHSKERSSRSYNSHHHHRHHSPSHSIPQKISRNNSDREKQLKEYRYRKESDDKRKEQEEDYSNNRNNNFPKNLYCCYCRTPNPRQQILCGNSDCKKLVTGEAVRCAFCSMPVGRDFMNEYCWSCRSKYTEVGINDPKSLPTAKKEDERQKTP